MTSVMDRRAFITTVSGSVLAGPLIVAAQPAGKAYRIGLVAAAKALVNFLRTPDATAVIRAKGMEPASR